MIGDERGDANAQIDIIAILQLLRCTCCHLVAVPAGGVTSHYRPLSHQVSAFHQGRYLYQQHLV